MTHIDPTHAKAFNGMGVSYDHLGQFDLATESYSKALAINPNLHYVQNNLGYSLLLQGDVDNAITTFKKATTLNGENKRYHNNLGLAYAEKGLHDLAFQEFKLAGGSLKAREDIEKEGADFLRRGLGAETGTDRESPGNAVRIGALESYSSMEQTPSVNNGRAQTSAYPFAVDSWTATLEKMEKDPTYEEVGAMTDQRSSHHSLDRVFLVGQRDDRDVEIEISNGNGVRHMARRVGGYLKEKGHKVTRLTNAQHFQFTDTTIYYCSGHLQDAYQVAREMPGWNEMIRVANLERPSIKLKVLIGKDLIVYSSLFERKGWDGDLPRPLKIANLSPDGR